MINNCNICVWDTETSGLDACVDEVVEIGCVMLDPRSLEIIPSSEFISLMRPVNIMRAVNPETKEPEDVEAKWKRAEPALRVNKKTRAELEAAPLPEQVFRDFCRHVAKYNCNMRNDQWNRPIAAGHNIQGFDMLFLDVLCKRYGFLDKDGRQGIFNRRVWLDTLNVCWLWFENAREPDKLNMDILRAYFGIQEEGHSALVDSKTSAEILRRFMKLHRRYQPKVKFKGAFASV